jgi:hypothetical protein
VKNFDTAYGLTINLSKPAKIAYVYGKSGHLLNKFDISKKSDTTYQLSLNDINHHLVAINIEKFVVVFDKEDYDDNIEISVNATVCFFDYDERSAIYASCNEKSNNDFIVNVPEIFEKK